MIHVNEATLMGNVGGDPDVTVMNDGTKRARFRLATTRKWKDADGNPVERTEWHTIVVFAPFAEAASRYVRKGEALMVRGRIEQREWKDGDGEIRRNLQITVAGAGSMLNLLGPRPRPAAADEERSAGTGNGGAEADAAAGTGGASEGAGAAGEERPGELAV